MSSNQPPVPFVLEHGPTEAPLLLCLHGIGSHAAAFVPQFPLAEQLGLRLVAWDAPGYRNSADPPSAPGTTGWADMAAELIRHKTTASAVAPNVSDAGSLTGPIVLGVSWGGVIATSLCLRHPELVGALILADSSSGAGGSPETSKAMRERSTGLVSLGAEEFARTRTQVLVSSNADDQLRAQVAQMMVEALRMPSYGWACDAMADTYHAPLLEQIQVPTLVIVGEHDQVTPPKASERLAAGIPGAELKVIPGAGHLANQEKPVEFNRLVAEFVESLG